jgi:hypothetical protein
MSESLRNNITENKTKRNLSNDDSKNKNHSISFITIIAFLGGAFMGLLIIFAALVFVFSFVGAFTGKINPVEKYGGKNESSTKNYYKDYEIGDKISTEELDITVYEFLKGSSMDTMSSKVNEDTPEVVLLQLEVENKLFEEMSFSGYDVKLRDENGRCYQSEICTNENLGNTFSGNDIPANSYEKGCLAFIVQDNNSEFTLFYNEREYINLGSVKVDLEVDLGAPKAKPDKLNGETENQGNSLGGDELSYENAYGLNQEKAVGDKYKYTSSLLDVSITLPEDEDIDVRPGCLLIGQSLSVGRVVLDKYGYPSRCFSFEFGNITKITNTSETFKINGKTFNMNIQKLEYASPGKKPEDVVPIEDLDSSAFFHVVLRGDEENPTGEDYLAVGYHGSWRNWEMDKEKIKGYLETLEY